MVIVVFNVACYVKVLKIASDTFLVLIKQGHRPGQKSEEAIHGRDQKYFFGCLRLLLVQYGMAVLQFCDL